MGLPFQLVSTRTFCDLYINLLSSLLLVVADLSRSLAVQGPEKNLLKKCLAHSMHRSGPLVGVARGLGTLTT
jgi:hypothetical protein